MPDALFDVPRLAALYDPLEAERPDLEVYAAMVAKFGASRVLDVGRGSSRCCWLGGGWTWLG